MMMGEITSFYIEGEIRVTTILIKNWKKKEKGNENYFSGPLSWLLSIN